jgi:hypothetical protein
MKKLTYNEIIEKLKNCLELEEFAYEDIQNEYLEKNGIPIWEEIDQVGGEGQGDHWHSVKYFKDHDVYIKVTGFYSSYNGTDFDGWDDSCEEVKPQTRTVVVFE